MIPLSAARGGAKSGEGDHHAHVRCLLSCCIAYARLVLSKYGLQLSVGEDHRPFYMPKGRELRTETRVLKSLSGSMPRLPFFRDRSEGRDGAVDPAPFLALLEDDLRQRVRKRLMRQRLQSGKTLYMQGDQPDALYLIEAGRFRVFMHDRRGKERVLQFLGPGEIAGEEAFIAETPSVTSAEAIEDASVWRLARVDFDSLLGAHAGLLRYLANVISERQELANARLAAESAPEETRASRGFVTAVYSPRGGAGVTTLALTLGTVLAERNPDDVALLDLDVLFGHALANLRLEPRGVLAQATPTALRNLDSGGLDFYLVRHASSLSVFPAATKPEEGQTITSDHIRASLDTLRRHFGHIVLDLPHSFNDVALTGLELADRVLVVATPERATLKDVLEARRIVLEVLLVPSDHLGYVLNHPGPHAGLAIAEFAAATGAPWSEIDHGGDLPTTAALRGESLVDSRRDHVVVRAVMMLADEVSKKAHERAALLGHSR